MAMSKCLQSLFVTAAFLAVLHGTLTSANDSPNYRVEVYRQGLTAGKHFFRLIPEGAKATEVEALTHPEANSHPSAQLGPYNQSLYFPTLEVTVKDNSGILVVAAVTVVFEFHESVANFVVPPFHFSLREANSYVDIIRPALWRAAANQTEVHIPVPAGDDGSLHVNDLPPIMLAVLKPEKITITTWVYQMNGFPEELFTGNVYDLNPGNASMLFKFLAKYDKTKDELGIWVSRRPPIPDFTFILARDGEVAAAHNSHATPVGGIGISDAFEAVKDHPHSNYTFVAHFYEPFNEAPSVATLTTKDHDTIFEALRGGRDKFIDHAMYQISSSSPKTQFVFKYYNDTRHIALQFLHKMPLMHAMISVYDKNDRIIFREQERIIPYNPSEPFGWYFVFPTLKAKPGAGKAKEAEADADDEGDDEELKDDDYEVTEEFIRAATRIELHFEERPQLHPVELMGQWLRDNGGNIDDVRVSENIQRAFEKHSHSNQELLRLRGLVSKREFKKDDIVATIPYRTLMSSRTLELNEWARRILRNSSLQYQKIAKEHGFQADGIYFMLLAYMAVTQPHHPAEGTNWRLYFDTWPKDHPPLPLFYSATEHEYFSFDPSIKVDANKMKAMWSAEYGLLSDAIPWWPKAVSLQKYTVLRAHVESRVVNASGTYVMIPLMDFMNHADDNSIRVSYRDEQQQIVFIANEGLSVDAPLTTNYGSKTLTKRDFLVQFGFIPPGAIDSVEIQFEGEPYHVTDNKDSLRFLRSAIEDSEKAKRNGGIAETDDDEDGGSLLTAGGKQILVKLLQDRLSALPTEVHKPRTTGKPHNVHTEQEGVTHLLSPSHQKDGGLELWASRLLASQRQVLQYHLTQLAEHGSQ